MLKSHKVPSLYKDICKWANIGKWKSKKNNITEMVSKSELKTHYAHSSKH